MNWKAQLEKYEHAKDWQAAINLMQAVVEKESNNLDPYLSLNYLLMNLLVEEDYEDNMQDYYVKLSKKYFHEAYNKYQDNAEFLFYSGVTAHLSEWYFDIDISQAKLMLEKALLKEPENTIYKWAYYTYRDMSNQDEKHQGINLAKTILEDDDIETKLQSKGALGKYILDIMKSQVNNV